MNNNLPKWFPLDNAAKIFPGQNSKRWSSVFRVGVELKEDVDPDALKKAADKALNRIPCFNVSIKKGFFWFYFEKNPNSFKIREDINNFCYRINFKEDNGFLIRVSYYKKCINLDVYHAISDGYGAIVFLMTLTGEYLRIKGKEISYNQFVLNTDNEPDLCEIEDSYNRYASSSVKYNRKDNWVYHNKGTRLPIHKRNYTLATMSFNELYSVSKSYSVTVTELFAAILTYVHYRKQLSEGGKQKEICIQVPVNCRKAFPSNSLRNFVLCLRLKTLPREKEYTFEEILRNISEELKRVNNKELINSLMTQNLKIEKQAAKFIPLPIKNLGIALGFLVTAEQTTTSLLSNLGLITVPDNMEPYIERLLFYTGAGLVNSARCAVISFGDKLSFSFSNCYKEKNIEKDFFSYLASMGVKIKLESNGDLSEFEGIEGCEIVKDSVFSDKVYFPSKKDKHSEKERLRIAFKERMERFFHI